MEFRYEAKIPKARVAVFLGVKGSIKKRIEKELDIKIDVNSDTGDIALAGDDSLKLIIGQSIARAIGRGFNPLDALDLLNDDAIFESLDIAHYVGNKKNRIITARARAIGSEGTARKYIEELTDTKIAVYGKTISIIGNYETAELARKSFESLLSGQRHSTVYAWLEKKKKEMKVSMY